MNKITRINEVSTGKLYLYGEFYFSDWYKIPLNHVKWPENVFCDTTLCSTFLPVCLQGKYNISLTKGWNIIYYLTNLVKQIGGPSYTRDIILWLSDLMSWTVYPPTPPNQKWQFIMNNLGFSLGKVICPPSMKTSLMNNLGLQILGKEGGRTMWKAILTIDWNSLIRMQSNIRKLFSDTHNSWKHLYLLKPFESFTQRIKFLF